MRRLVLSGIVVALAAAAPGARASHPLDLIAPVDGPIVRHFEPPPDPYSAGHRGIDLATAAGSPVVAAAGGLVAFAGQVGGSLFVSIDHPGGLRTTYSFLGAVAVRTGEAVIQGQVIAASGPGHAGGGDPHLHFGLRRGETYLDPEAVLLESLRRNLWRVVRLVG